MSILPHSFDTVVVRIPCKDAAVADRFFQRTLVESYNADGSLRASFDHKRYFRQPGQFEGDEVPSWWTPPLIEVHGFYLTYQFSLPKLLFGHSARHASDLGVVLQGLEDYLQLDCDVELSAPWPRWQVRRLDLCYNFKLPIPAFVVDAEAQLARLRYRGRLALTDRRGSFPYWPSSTRTLKFYGKGQEMWAHRKEPGNHYPDGWLEARLWSLSCILRYEEEWRGKQLIRFCGVETLDQVTAGLLLSRLVSRFPVEDHILKIQNQFTARGPIVSMRQALNQAEQLRGRSRGPAVRFLLAIDERGLEPVRQKMSSSAYQRVMSNLRRVGVEPATVENRWDKRWEPPVDISQWVTIENLCHEFDGEDILEDPLYLAIRARAYDFVGQNYKIG